MTSDGIVPVPDGTHTIVRRDAAQCESARVGVTKRLREKRRRDGLSQRGEDNWGMADVGPS